MIVLGVDPGVARTGYGVLEEDSAGKLILLAAELIETSQNTPPDRRLFEQYQIFKVILKKYRPDALAIERVYHGANTKTVVSVGQAMGVAMLAASEESIPVQEYTPLQVKSAVTGYGSADKTQVQKMVKSLLGLREVLSPDDVSDAVAVAICHIHSAKMVALS